MHMLLATYRVATDMFLSRDGQDAELRASSIRGALRFWYRAMMWPKVTDLSKIKALEARLFGASDQAIGQSRVLVSVISDSQPKSIPAGSEVDESVAYLGYGVMGFTKRYGRPGVKTTRASIPAGHEFSVRVLFRPLRGAAANTLKEDVEHVSGALQALGLFGGLGSRSRNGLGSVNLQRLERVGPDGERQLLWTPVRDVRDLVNRQREWVRKYLGEMPDGEPEYTAFSKGSKIVTQATEGDGMAALAHVGAKLGGYRRYRKSQDGINQPNFPDDHDNMYKFAQNGTKTPPAPRRSVFGLPHNYFLSSIKHTVTISARVNGKSIDRRAGPLFIHIHDFGGQSRGSAVTFTFLPAKFLPDGAELVLTATRPKPKNEQNARNSGQKAPKNEKEIVNAGTATPTSDWTPILTFMSDAFWPNREVVL